MKENFVLVADRAKARLLRGDGKDSDLSEVQCFSHSEARIPRHEQERRPPPSTHDRMGAHRHSIEEHTPAREREAQHFAHELLQALESLRRSDRLEHWALIAPPEFLGELRAQMPAELGKLLAFELDSNLTQLGERELTQRLPKGIWRQ